MKFFYLLCTIILITGCSKIDYPNNINTISITKETHPCMSHIPEYTITVLGNGTIKYIGLNNVNTTGIKYSTISESEILELFDEFYDLNFFSLKNEYNDNYLMQVSDACATTISISFDDYQKSVYNFHGAPKKFEYLSKKIDSATNSSRWVDGSGY